MRRILPMLVLAILGGAVMLPAADGVAAATSAPTPTPTPAASARVAFGLIIVAADGHSLTITDPKGVALTLAITAKTAVTLDLDTVPLARLKLDKNVRVTFTGATADAIDQLSPEKKKKKKA